MDSPREILKKFPKHLILGEKIKLFDFRTYYEIRYNQNFCFYIRENDLAEIMTLMTTAQDKGLDPLPFEIIGKCKKLFLKRVAEVNA